MAAANAAYQDCQKLMDLQREVELCVENRQDHLQADTEGKGRRKVMSFLEEQLFPPIQ